jgi:hypothetical protein
LVLIVPYLGAVFDIALVPIRLCLGVYLALALPWCVYFVFWLCLVFILAFGSALVLIWLWLCLGASLALP